MNDTRSDIIRAGMDLWRHGSEADVTARGIGAVLGISHAAVLYHFSGGVSAMRMQIAEAAVSRGDAAIIPKLIVGGHPAVAGMPASDRQMWLSRL